MNQDNYCPTQNGIQAQFRDLVEYIEHRPNDPSLRNIISCFWSLSTNTILTQDFVYTVMPDACIDIVFDATAKTGALIMTPHLTIEEINLGKTFHYIGLRLRPGTLKNETMRLGAIVGEQLELDNLDDISMDSIAAEIKTAPNTTSKLQRLETFASDLYANGIIQQNPLVANVISGLQFGLSQEQIAKKLGYSSRQLRRIITSETGFTPIQLLRVIRFQQSISRQDVSLRFADQSHLIKEFQKITGRSFTKFINEFS